MSETPYQAPADDHGAPAPPHTRPRSLMIAAALSAALGVFGLLGVAWGCFGSVVSLATPTAFSGGLPPEQAAAQAALVEATRPFLFVGLALYIAVIPLAVALLVGGVNVLADKPAGIGWLSNAWLFGLVVEPVRLIVQIAQSVVLWEPMMASTTAMATPPPGQPLPPGMEGVMGGVVVFSLVLGFAVSFGWFLCKMALYAWGRRVIASEATQDWILSKT